MDVLKAKLDLEQVEGAKNDVVPTPWQGGCNKTVLRSLPAHPIP